MNWLRNHPLKAVSFTLLCTFIGTFAGCRADLFAPLLVAFLLVLFIFVLVFHHDNRRKLVVFLLAFLMVMAPCRPPAVSASQKKGGEVVVGVVIICGMTYCVYRLARFCQQHFPPPNTNNVANNFGPAGVNNSNVVYGASFALTSDPCASAGTNFVISPTSFTINAMVHGGQLRTAVSASSESSSMEEFISGVQAQGLLAGTTSYAIDGEPAPPSSVPISFQPTTGTITNGITGTAFLITVQASSDMQSWQTLFSTTAGEGTAFQVQDTVTSAAMFYRLELR